MKKTITTNQQTLITALAAVIQAGQTPTALASRRASIEIASTTDNLPVRHLTLAARKLPRKFVFIEGSPESSFDWMLMRLADDPLYGDRRGFPLPGDVKSKLQSIHQAGLTFDDLWIAHELRKGNFNERSKPTVADLYPLENLKQPVARPNTARGILSCLNALASTGAVLGSVAGRVMAAALAYEAPTYVPESYAAPKRELEARPEPVSWLPRETAQLERSEKREAEAERVAYSFEIERQEAESRKLAAIESHNRQAIIEADKRAKECAKQQAEAQRIANLEAERQAEIERVAELRREEQERKDEIDRTMWQRMKDGKQEWEVLDTGRKNRWDLYDLDKHLFPYDRFYAQWSLVRFGGERHYDERSDEVTYSCQGQRATFPDPILLGVNYEAAYADLFYLAHWRY